ncbi:Gmad2 immunoglobulin-like domain-containing protein [Bacillus taeanensis]|uniref:Bacterial spore germination immunoglobulin-like domain-containing protein n=1 Tax=Bacillus taeanensis TaxID=273032 RepID=A0A366Y3X8_9BACI|nr:Gmad2 immunoglobulin-like domain-containing protein [Bacillus taeanensis]RBW71094.1 hypothetical protein DS031_03625 [Bacillus taeanensis]
MKIKMMFLLMLIIGALIAVSGCQGEKETTDNNDSTKIEEEKTIEEEENNEAKEAEKEQDTEEVTAPKVEGEPEQEEPSAGEKEEQEQNATVLENEAFKITSPLPNQKINGSFLVEGEARVFEANFLYRLEDGHNVLAEGFVTASEGAPGWGEFSFEINYEGATSPSAVLVIYEGSAKDGSPQHELFIPLQVEDYE